MGLSDDLQKRAAKLGVKLNGVAAHRIPEKGVGIIAEKDLKVGDTLMEVPVSAVRSVLTVPKSISKAIIGDVTVQGLLAAEMALDTSKERDWWRATLPTLRDFQASIPMMWPPTLQSLLPSAASRLVAKQRDKVSLDWKAVTDAFPNIDYDRYLHNWFLVGTRTFYYTSPRMKLRIRRDRDECLALLPFADYFNHADAGCEVTFSSSGYELCASRPITKGEEVYISYGQHSNDFLLAEYGFVLDENKRDCVLLDEVLLPWFTTEQQGELKEHDYHGDFVLDSETVCYRTQVALRLLCMPLSEWQQNVRIGFDEDDGCQQRIDQLLLQALTAYLTIVQERLRQISKLEGIHEHQEYSRSILKRRWQQICGTLTDAIPTVEARVE